MSRFDKLRQIKPIAKEIPNIPTISKNLEQLTDEEEIELSYVIQSQAYLLSVDVFRKLKFTGWFQ